VTAMVHPPNWENPALMNQADHSYSPAVLRSITDTGRFWTENADVDSGERAVEERLYVSASMRNDAGIDQMWGRGAENR
jgi:hypothetical protein